MGDDRRHVKFRALTADNQCTLGYRKIKRPVCYKPSRHKRPVCHKTARHKRPVDQLKAEFTTSNKRAMGQLKAKLTAGNKRSMGYFNLADDFTN